MLHGSCAQSTTPFLCKFCLRKKQIRERESKTDDFSDQDDSNSEAEEKNGETEAVYSASPLNSKSLLEIEYKPAARLVADPFSIDSQNDQESQSRLVIWRNIKTKVIHHQEIDAWSQNPQLIDTPCGAKRRRS